MTIKEALYKACLLLKPITPDAFLEAEILLRYILEVERTKLFTQGETTLSPQQEENFWSLIRRRLNHEPIPYITGHREFYGLDFYVNPHTLIPRPESELLVERAIELSAQFSSPLLVADIGTGCGAIALSLALNLPQAQIYAIDISPEALQVAEQNCQRYHLEERVHFLLGDMLSPLPHPVHIIVANLPYIPTEEIPHLPPEVRLFEPLAALNGGKDGLEKIKALLSQAPSKLRKGGYLLMEIGQGQGERVKDLAKTFFADTSIELCHDLSGVPRIIQVGLMEQNNVINFTI
jgi:release factor glutamine methyltransferase